MIPEFGLFSLIIALMMSLIGGVMAPLGLVNARLGFLQQLARPAIFTQCLFILVAFITLMSCFAQDDFTLAYVANNSNTHLPWVYKLCALWGAHEGSLLLWAFILAAWTLAVMFYVKKLPQPIAITVTGTLCAINIGFLWLLLQTSDPFSRLLPFSPNEGADLNPLLQDPGFVLHPPFLYMGYVGLAVPFAFAISALIFKEKASGWTAWARPWALLAWSFLTVGITLGSWWAYYELGWGGWWFWDPVENASFMPWLVATALVHALYISDKRKLFQSWSLLLALSAFILSLIGTFLVRSGVISSVHAFASDPARGMFILAFLSIVVIASLGLYLWRGVYRDNVAVNLFSRESLMLLANIVLYVATLTVLLGTLYPIMADVLLNERLSVGPPYFNKVFNPMMLPLIILMAIAPHIKWQQDTKLATHKIKYGIGVLLAGLCTLLLPNSFSLMAKLTIILAGMLLLSTLFMAWRYRANVGPRAGMIIAHCGVGLSLLGIALSTSLETEKELVLSVGESVQIQGYDFEFKALNDIQGSNFEGLKATFLIKQNNKLLYETFPEKRYFIPRNLPMTETAIVPRLSKDFYIALGERLDNGSWTLRIYIKPFVRFIWLGGLLIALGALLASLRAFTESRRGNHD